MAEVFRAILQHFPALNTLKLCKFKKYYSLHIRGLTKQGYPDGPTSIVVLLADDRSAGGGINMAGLSTPRKRVNFIELKYAVLGLSCLHHY